MAASLKNDSDDTDSGFRAELTGVALADLVQLECAARSNRAFRVRSGNAVGYLYFAQGQIVHAATETAVGESAAVELLSWSDGTFEASALPLPATPTIRRGWQHLLMMAAQAQDEVRRRKLVTFPKSHRSSVTAVAPRPDPRPAEPPKPPEPIRVENAPVTVSTQSSADSSVAAYAVRLADLIGDDLGLGGVLALEVELGTSHVFAQRDQAGRTITMSAANDGEAAPLREQLGL